jgi:hypothetical protein
LFDVSGFHGLRNFGSVIENNQGFSLKIPNAMWNCLFAGFWHVISVNKTSRQNGCREEATFMKTVSSISQRSRFLKALVSAACLLPAVLRADVIELVNGDRYYGSLIGVTQTNVELKSEIQGKVNIPRDKVATIMFRETAAQRADVAKSITGKKNAKTSALADELRAQGINPKDIGKVPEEILSGANPEATAQFKDMVAGLMTGQLSVDSIRAQAQKSVEEIHAMKEDLGEEGGELLDGYLLILENFLKETDKSDAVKPKEKAPTPPKKKSPPAPDE